MSWIELTRTKDDKKRGWNICPYCKGILEVEMVSGQIVKERCKAGCYIFDFEKKTVKKSWK